MPAAALILKITWIGLYIVLYLLLADVVFQFAVGCGGIFAQKSPIEAKSLRKFAVLIPAHNEAAVLAPLLRSLNGQRYPRDHYRVFVSCDDCGDDTAGVAVSCGAEAFIRSSFAKKGKTWNVKWALEKIPMDDFDAIALFDADNLAEADFLSSMNDYMEEHPGADAIQGMLDVKNPNDNWLTMSYATAYWFTNRFWQMARATWGLSCTMGGTGLVVKTSALRRLGWNYESLTEDLEMSTRMILSGSRVHWNDHAVIYDEKPQSLSASMRQRTRWMRGHYWTLWNYGKPVFSMFIKTRKIQYLDLLMYLLAPAKCCVAVLALAAGTALTLAERGTFSADTAAPLISLFGLPFVTAVVFCALCSVLGSSIRHGRVMLGCVRHVPAFFWYGLTWLPIIFRALFAVGRQGDWISTEHTRNLSLEQMTRRE